MLCPRTSRGTRKKLRAAVRAIYGKEVTENDLAGTGFTLADYPDAAAELWPDNLLAANAFIAISTQWRTGYSGATGLDYNVIPSVFRLIGIPRLEWADTFECVRVMEAEAMTVMAEQRD